MAKKRLLTTAKLKAMMPVIPLQTTSFLKIFISKKLSYMEATAVVAFILCVLLIIPRIDLAAEDLVATVQEFSRPVPVAPTVDTDPIGYALQEEAYESELALSKAVQEDATRAFYTKLCKGNHRIVDAVYEYADGLNKDYVFALLMGESEGNPLARNENIDKVTGQVISIDRGLFQLNSRSYPFLSESEFYNIETNVRYGIAHIRGELEYHKGNTRKALWTYNAGRYASVVPTKTLRYADKILMNTKRYKAERESFIRSRLAELSLYSSINTKG